MESYKSDLESYLSCMKRESDSAIMEYNDAVASFNRRAEAECHGVPVRLRRGGPSYL